MSTGLTILLPILGAVLCAGAGVCLAFASFLGVGAMFCAGLALILWFRSPTTGIVVGAVAAVLASADQVRQFRLGQQRLLSFALFVSVVFLSVIGTAVEYRRVRSQQREMTDDNHVA